MEGWGGVWWGWNRWGAGPHLVAVLVVLEARVVVHESVELLEALVLLLRL